MSAGALMALMIAVPVLGAALTMLVRSLAAQRGVAVVAVIGSLAAAVALALEVESGGTTAVQVGGWAAPFGITLVADLLSVLLAVVSLATVLCVQLFAIGHLERRIESDFFHPLFLVLVAGVSASFLAGDLFNLFVAFEVMLIASYVLITIGGNRSAVRPAMTYVVISLLASTLLLTAVALLYAATGTVNMADLSLRVAELPAALRGAFALLLLVVFGIKAAIFPLFFWLPDSYPTAPTPVTAVFAGLLTKVGVYAILRTQTIVLGGGDGGPSSLLLTLAGVTMVVGVLGAIAQEDIKRILSFHIVSQIGYMILGIGLFTVAGLAGAILFLLHQIPVKTSLFLVGGMVEKATGTVELARLGGLARRLPVAAWLWLLAAFSLAGLPPFSGFFGKLALVQAGFGAQRWVVTGVALAASILTLYSMTKIWAGAFWGEPVEATPAHDVEARRLPALLTISTVALVGVSLAIALFVEPLNGLSVRAAEELADPSAYIQAVLGSQGGQR